MITRAVLQKAYSAEVLDIDSFDNVTMFMPMQLPHVLSWFSTALLEMANVTRPAAMLAFCVLYQYLFEAKWAELRNILNNTCKHIPSYLLAERPTSLGMCKADIAQRKQVSSPHRQAQTLRNSRLLSFSYKA